MTHQKKVLKKALQLAKGNVNLLEHIAPDVIVVHNNSDRRNWPTRNETAVWK